MRGPKHPWVEMVLSCVFIQFVGELFGVILVDFMASFDFQEQLLQQQLVLLQSSPRFGSEKRILRKS